jgi:hypothetical protein
LIEKYFQAIVDLLASLPFVSSSAVNLDKRTELIGFVRGEVGFKDGSTLLFFRELVDLSLQNQKVMYAYHYQTSEGTLIFRYDDTAHHSSISTFPHHKHIVGGRVIEANPPTLEDVLKEIEEYLDKK